MVVGGLRLRVWVWIKWLDFGYILSVESVGFFDGLDKGCERKRGVKDGF